MIDRRIMVPHVEGSTRSSMDYRRPDHHGADTMMSQGHGML